MKAQSKRVYSLLLVSAVTVMTSSPLLAWSDDDWDWNDDVATVDLLMQAAALASKGADTHIFVVPVGPWARGDIAGMHADFTPVQLFGDEVRAEHNADGLFLDNALDEDVVGLWKGLIEGGDVHHISAVLCHEMVHAAIAQNYPAFAAAIGQDKDCRSCSEYIAYAETAKSLCAAAAHCPLDPPSWTVTDKKKLVAEANAERRKGKREQAKNGCTQCPAEPKPPIPGLPPKCEYQSCG